MRCSLGCVNQITKATKYWAINNQSTPNHPLHPPLTLSNWIPIEPYTLLYFNSTHPIPLPSTHSVASAVALAESGYISLIPTRDIRRAPTSAQGEKPKKIQKKCRKSWKERKSVHLTSGIDRINYLLHFSHTCLGSHTFNIFDHTRLNAKAIECNFNLFSQKHWAR